jgi:cytidine deaminase
MPAEFASLPWTAQELLREARVAADHAYHPYSDYLVGAAVRTGDDSIFSGTFMENTSFGMTICAEPAAVLAANTAGHRDIITIAVAGGSPSGPEGGPCTPCGRCRQVLWEMALLNATNIEVICSNLTLTAFELTTIHDLLPSPWPPAPESFTADRPSAFLQDGADGPA